VSSPTVSEGPKSPGKRNHPPNNYKTFGAPRPVPTPTRPYFPPTLYPRPQAFGLTAITPSVGKAIAVRPPSRFSPRPTAHGCTEAYSRCDRSQGVLRIRDDTQFVFFYPRMMLFPIRPLTICRQLAILTFFGEFPSVILFFFLQSYGIRAIPFPPTPFGCCLCFAIPSCPPLPSSLDSVSNSRISSCYFQRRQRSLTFKNNFC